MSTDRVYTDNHGVHYILAMGGMDYSMRAGELLSLRARIDALLAMGAPVEAVVRPNHLAWNGTEWVDGRCGCRFHPDDDNGTHGGGPHVHPCEHHTHALVDAMGQSYLAAKQATDDRIEAARADERRLERARAERDHVRRLREAADEFIAAMPPGVSDERVRLSSIASAFRDEADDIEERLAKADPEPAPAPVEWVDGRAIVGEVSVQWDGGAHFDLHIQGDEEDGTRLTPSSQFDTHAAKRLAIAVARALAETGRTP